MSNWEIHNIEDTAYKRVGGKVFEGSSPDSINDRLYEFWLFLAVTSHETLDTDFKNLYSFGGSASSAYDIEGRLGHLPPTATIQSADTDVKLLLPAYKSMEYRTKVRPAVLGIYAHHDHLPAATIFAKNVEHLRAPLGNGNVYAVLKRPDGSPLESRYDTVQDFRQDYFRVIAGEQGEVIVITDDQNQAAEAFEKLQIEKDLDRIARKELAVPAIVQTLPRFLQRVWVRQMANQ